MLFRITPALKLLLVINVAVYVIDNLLFGTVAFDGIPLNYLILKYFALQPVGGYITISGMEFAFYPWQLITYQFMHGGFTHILFNMFGLWMFGSELEEHWGSAKFLVYYLCAGIGAGVLHMILSVMLGSVAPTIGASGSLYGIIIGFAMLNPDRKIMMFPLFIPIPARIFGIGMMVISMIMGLTSSDGIAHFAHFGGALTGLFLLKFGEATPLFKLSRKHIHFGIPSNEYINDWNNANDWNSKKKVIWKKEQNYRVEWADNNAQIQQKTEQQGDKTRRIKLNELEIGGVKITQEMIDAILDKISKTGYQSLTEQEKYILTEVSKLL